MENKLTVWTTCNKIYEKYIPLFALSHLFNNNDAVVEIGIEDDLEEKTIKCVEIINQHYDNRLFIRKIPFNKYPGLAIGAVRFINQPEHISKYVYITDIDIICLDKEIADIHAKQMMKTGLPYCNMVRIGTRKLTGLHFSKWDSIYPLPDIDKLIADGHRRDESRILCDEILLHEIVANKCEINYSLKYRPVHGIHISQQRQPLPTESVPGWEIELDKMEAWTALKASNIFRECYPSFFSAIKKVVSQIDETFDYLQKVKYKGLCYTAIIGNYETLKNPTVVSKDFEYICFTTNRDILAPLKGQPCVWHIIYIDLPKDKDPTRIAREIKILYNKYINTNYKYIVWVDGSIEIKCDLNYFIQENDIDNNDMITIKHPHRDCIYQEAERCKFQNKDKAEIIDKQVEKYKSEGYPEHMGLISSGILIRNNTKIVKNFMAKWYEEIINGSKRDQMAFNYILWKYPIKVKLVEYNVAFDEANEDRFILRKHG